jgi:predicted O-linked N-acetylglucosamine transferase (SPINDLY family)
MSVVGADQIFQQAAAAYRRGDRGTARLLATETLERSQKHFGALTLLGILAAEGGDAERAVQWLQRAAAANVDSPIAHNNLGNALRDLRRNDEALQCYERAILLAPAYAHAHFNRANALVDLGRIAAAVESYERAIALDPSFADALNNLGNAFRMAKRYTDAIRCYERVLALRPDYPFLPGSLLLLKRHICDWRGAEAEEAALLAGVERGDPVTPPFPLLALCGSAALQRRAAEIWAERSCPAPVSAFAPVSGAPRERVRVGYFSADFRDHALSYLLAEVLELHDRQRFEWIGFSFGPPNDDPMRRRVLRALDRFLDVRDMTDGAIAAASRELQVDIAVDLTGFAEGSRPGIFARRAAPVQVNYLGYPGTLGGIGMDYLIADGVLVPPGSEHFYSERIVRLPHTSRAYDSKRVAAEQGKRRDEAGLPPDGFVFCCFNNSFKITPAWFDLWMRILAQVGGSVLWLLEDNPVAVETLRAEAGRRGIAPARLVFAPRRPPEEHLARHRLADLFLDTFPCGAHTTASDALWAGLPVLTMAGEAFASRVAASLLAAVDLPELIAGSAEQYESIAVTLAHDRSQVESLKRRLAGVLPTAPPFDAGSLARHLEAAYATMYRRCCEGLPPEAFEVPP